MILKTEHLKKRYGSRTVLDGVSISVASGEIVGLLGPNGAGKTTTFYMVVGMVHGEDGKILLDSQELSKTPMYKRARLGIGYLPQEPSIFRKLTVEDNLKIILEILPISEKERKEKEEKLLKELGLEERRKQIAGTLSGGEKRRLEIARALLNNPKFLLLDEPFVGIDPITVSDLQEILNHLKQRGLGILITDHNVRDTLKIIDRAYIIHQGKVLLEGDAQTLLESPEARRIYLGEQFQI
ncbi:MAG: LPS export ABC transporter ATP-binding protein [Elusimicrobia bacterium RIFCSPLOWO2_02_FULL_39_32]|nr:MAG: LPS export ABC transporter ATP-binding protein [Elusimicrobia bacterium GWA2_38_7]OGR79602.1 MAG: LPS export ABC transporter ATP-binding protein [Elusimicrobia bacterium RIFCSPHIGHO2_02_FULL_39_36]OGR92929.1 MAG: LPS export ABC transporter ATP-binding protein [Elusimicrobia bacterium RIFCSPLOWO2_02_FULL_39_32]OGR99712.1 MAG: LPS export ABC transporter ATP-binding protein [Elusimicrobia bacterium RIFCSPLOWO2_12_FULL_39_28]